MGKLTIEQAKGVIFRTEKQVEKFMVENGISKKRFYITAYVNENNNSVFGYTLNNVNSDYYFQQKEISRKTQTFTVNS